MAGRLSTWHSQRAQPTRYKGKKKKKVFVSNRLKCLIPKPRIAGDFLCIGFAMFECLLKADLTLLLQSRKHIPKIFNEEIFKVKI